MEVKLFDVIVQIKYTHKDVNSDRMCTQCTRYKNYVTDKKDALASEICRMHSIIVDISSGHVEVGICIFTYMSCIQNPLV